MRIFFFASLLLMASAPFNTYSQARISKIFILRHADRQDNLDALSPAGVARSTELARLLGQAKIDSIFSTNFVRTKQTVQPLALQRMIPVEIYLSTGAVIKRVLTNSPGKRVVIVGHSDTVADLISKCGCTPPAAITPNIPSSQFDNLFELLVQKIPGQAQLKCEFIFLKYGAVTN